MSRQGEIAILPADGTGSAREVASVREPWERPC